MLSYIPKNEVAINTRWYCFFLDELLQLVSDAPILQRGTSG